MYAEKDNLKNARKNKCVKFQVHVTFVRCTRCFIPCNEYDGFYVVVVSERRGNVSMDFKRFRLNVYAHFTDQSTSTT